jgi:hypothetical protein
LTVKDGTFKGNAFAGNRSVNDRSLNNSRISDGFGCSSSCISNRSSDSFRHGFGNSFRYSGFLGVNGYRTGGDQTKS